jgi:methyl-accepting chemotaxis protein
MKTYKRKHYFINKQLQTKYMVITIIMLLVYSALFVVILFLPYIIPLEFGTSLEEKTRAAKMLLELHKSVWPAIGTVILIMSGLSIFITHKIAGPVYRFKKVLAEISAGNLDITIKLRKYDDLQDLAEDMNTVVADLREFVRALKNDYQTMTVCIQELEEQLRGKSINDDSRRDLINKMQASRDNIARTLDKYSTR